MKKLWILMVFTLCGSLALAQFAHAFTMESTNCDTVKTEQHMDSSTTKATPDDSSSDKSATGESCCESCHLQMVSIPTLPVEKTVLGGELFAALSASPRGLLPDTLSEPPQA